MATGAMETGVMAAMKARVSVRTFDKGGFSDADRQVIAGVMERRAGRGPFGHAVRFALAAGESDGRPVKMGTYGLVSGAAGYVVAAVTRGPGAMEDLGYLTEALVLDLTALGFGTCWIGGVFSRGAAAAAIRAGEGEIVPIVIAAGRPADRRSLFDRIVTGGAKSRTRKLHDTMFFRLRNGRIEGIASPDGPFAEALEAVRIAPSASNKQPWRLVELPGGDGGDNPGGPRWLFCLAEDPVYNRAMGEARMQDVDIGIAMRHFEAALADRGIAGRWVPLLGGVTEAGSGAQAGADAGPDAAAARQALDPKWIPIARWEPA